MQDARPGLRSLAVSLAIAFVPALAGTPFVDPRWYERLDRPSWSPSPKVFGPVWTILYTLLGVTSWAAWMRRPRSSDGLALYFVQLGLNALWTPIFFGARRPGAALVVILGLWVTALATMVALLRARVWAAVLLIPYQLWLSFAAALNAAIWWRGRDAVRGPATR